MNDLQQVRLRYGYATNNKIFSGELEEFIVLWLEEGGTLETPFDGKADLDENSSVGDIRRWIESWDDYYEAAKGVPSENDRLFAEYVRGLWR